MFLPQGATQTEPGYEGICRPFWAGRVIGLKVVISRRWLFSSAACFVENQARLGLG